MSTGSGDRGTPRSLGPAFANLFTANLASSLGDGIARTAMPLLAARLTHDPLAIAILSAMALLPWLLFAIPSGIIVDSVDRRRALAVADGVRALLALALCALTATGSLTIGWLFAVIFVYGALETVYDGAARAVVPSVVAKANLPRANSRIEAGELVVQTFLSGPFTSVLFAVSVLIPLGVNAAAFALAAVLAVLLPRVASGRQFARPATEEKVPWRRQFLDGLRFIWASRMLRTLWLFSTFTGFWISAATATLVLFALDRLNVPEALFGVFMLTGAVGGLVGTAVTAPLAKRLGSGRAMALGNVLLLAGLLVMGLVPDVWVASAMWVVVSIGVTVWNVLVMSLRQAVIPGRLLGRVHGTWRTLLWGGMPLGYLVGGLLARIDLSVPFVLGGAVGLVATLPLWRFLVSLPNPEDVDNGDEAVAA
ncbi:MFS transporter [Microbacteriaceae bacterium 4G12]